jgi:hypothetical protein
VLDVQIWPAVLAGLIAGAVMEGPVYLQKALGLPVKQNIFRTWGNLLGLRGAGGYAAGLLFHEGLAAVIAIGYAVFFRVIGVDGSLWLWGLVGALVHYTLAGPVVKVLPSLNPDTGEVGQQGFAYRNYGALDVATSFVGHLSFGVLTGILYGVFHSGGGNALT